MYTGALESDTLRRSVLNKLDGLQFQCKPRLCVRCITLHRRFIFWKKEVQREENLTDLTTGPVSQKELDIKPNQDQTLGSISLTAQ